jgi:O-antigen/teichoic acid export membrane protein
VNTLPNDNPLVRVRSYLDQLLAKTLVHRTLWTLLSQVVRLGLQAAYFVIIARFLGVEQLGAFLGVRALTAIVAPFATWGSGHLLIKNVSRNRDLFRAYWGNALLRTCTFGFFFIVLLLLTSSLIFPRTISSLTILSVALADLIALKIVETAGQAFMASGFAQRRAQIHMGLGLIKLLAAIFFAAFWQEPALHIWAEVYFLSMATAAVAAYLRVHRLLGSPKPELSRIKPEFFDGFYFSVGLCAYTVTQDVDKTMLVRLSTLEAAGIYAAAYRVIEIALIPLRSLMIATYPEFFQHGKSGLKFSAAFAGRLLPLVAAYGFIAGGVIYLTAPLIPLVLGSDYGNSMTAIRLLAVLPLLQGLQYIAADTLTGANLHRIRSLMQALMAVANFSLNLWLIPIYSWKGAVWSTWAAEGLLAILLYSIVIHLQYGQSNSTSNTTRSPISE